MAVAVLRVLVPTIEPDALASLADDSSNYLVMARCFSPWSDPDVAVSSVCTQQYLPPVFPLLLALSGAAYSLPAAHALVLLAFLATIPCIWRHATVVLQSNALAHVAVAGFVVLPGTLLGLQGILSESLYLFFASLFFLLRRDDSSGASLTRAAVLGVVLGVLMSTRSIGIALLLAVLAQSIFCRLYGRHDGSRPGTVLFVAGLVAGAVRFPFPAASSPSDYTAVWAELLHSLPGIHGYFGSQAAALLQSWASYIALYWTDDRPAVWVVMMLLLTLSLAGLLLRLLRNALDAWYVAAYIAVLVLWPYPGQLLRFLFPVMPLLFLQGAWLLNELLRDRQRLRPVGWLAPALAFSVALPAHVFLLGRAELARSEGMNPVYEWLRKPAPAEARRELALQNTIFSDLADLADSLPPDAVVAYYEPSYVALFSGRRAVGLPFPVDAEAWQAARAAGATHLLLTRIHPRLSRSTVDGLSLRTAPPAWARPEGCTRAPTDDAPASCLYALSPGTTH